MSVDWTAIRSQYEQGISQRSLALKFGISQSAISQKAKKEKWLITPLITRASELITDNLPADPFSAAVDLSDLASVEKALLLVARRLDEEPENKDIKLLADAMSQFHKIKITLQSQSSEHNNSSPYGLQEFLAKCTDQELAIIQPVFDAVAARDKLEAEEKIKPIRKIG